MVITEKRIGYGVGVKQQLDPFFRHEIADYTIVEFEPTKYLPGFEKFR